MGGEGVCAHECVALRVLRSQISLELELEAVVSHPECVLGLELQSSAEAVSALNHGTISPARRLHLLIHSIHKIPLSILI